MAIVKANYVKRGMREKANAKANIRYIQNRRGKEGEKISRTLFGIDGLVGRWEAYRMIDEAEKGSIFFRFVISPDPVLEDTERDLFLRDVTEKTMQALEERIHLPVSWIAAEHDDHAPHRHVHVLAIVNSKLYAQDFHALRERASGECLQQRRVLDLARTRQQMRGEGLQWELGR